MSGPLKVSRERLWEATLGPPQGILAAPYPMIRATPVWRWRPSCDALKHTNPHSLYSCMFTWRRRMCRSCRPKHHPPCERSLSINKWACWVFTAVLRASLMEHSPCEIDTLSTCWQHPASKPAGPMGRPVLPAAFQEAGQEQASCTLPPSAQLQPWRLYF